MREKVTGVISFTGAVCWGLFGLFNIGDMNQGDEFLALFALLTASISTILYVVWTKFGHRVDKGLAKIEYENQILKKQIEKQELLKKIDK